MGVALTSDGGSLRADGVLPVGPVSAVDRALTG